MWHVLEELLSNLWGELLPFLILMRLERLRGRVGGNAAHAEADADAAAGSPGAGLLWLTILRHPARRGLTWAS